MGKIPVNIISGFLGAGKTTAILQLFSLKKTEEKWAVVINEFGKISIDSHTLRSNSPTGKVFDISGGCICCTAKGYLNDNLEEIIQTGLYSRIIIEPSGLGGIDMVSEIVELKPALLLKPVICLVDILGLTNKRLQMNPVYQRQIAKSDKIVFTKTDLVVDASELNELVARFKTNFPTASIHANYTVDISLLDACNHERGTVKSNNAYKIVDPALSASNYLQKNCIFDADTIFDTKKIRKLLSEHNCIVRAKGFIQTSEGWKLLNYTLTQCVFENCEPGNQNEIVIIAEKSEPEFFENFDAEIVKSIL